MCICMIITEPLCSTPETNTAVQISYIPIKFFKKKTHCKHKFCEEKNSRCEASDLCFKKPSN